MEGARTGRMSGKKLKVAGLAVFVIALAAAAGALLYKGSGEDSFSLDDWYCSPLMGTYNYSDKGIFYYGDEGISYFDAESGKGVSVCTKAGCRHEDENCPAFIEDSLFRAGIVYDGKKLYYIGDSEDLSSLNLTECDINGENRKKIADFPDIQSPSAIVYQGDFLAIGYYNGTDIRKREEVNNREAGIYVYDRKKKQGKKIYCEKAWNNTILSLNIIDGYLYFCRNYCPLSEEEILKQSASSKNEEQQKEVIELYRVPIDGGKEERIADQISTTCAGVTKVGEMVLFTTLDGLQAYLPQEGKRKTIRQGKNIFLVANRMTEETGIIGQGEKDGTSTYYVCDQDGALKKAGNSSIIFYAVYDHATYGIGDNNSIPILDTEKWRNGDFSIRHTLYMK